MWKTKVFHWYLTHANRDRFWHPRLGFVDSKQFSAFSTFTEMKYSEYVPDEQGGGTIEPQKLQVRLCNEVGFLPKPATDFSLDSWRQVAVVKSS